MDHHDVERRDQPRLRGVIHEYTVAAFAAAGVVLIILAGSARARLAMSVYATGLAGCIGTSALYHRGHWRPGVKDWLGRADHAAIFVLIAATYTPVCLVLLNGSIGNGMLLAAWTGAAVGIGLTFAWWYPPAWVEVAPYIGLGWLGALAIPQIVDVSGGGALAMLIVGGCLYTLGAIVYGLKWPDPFPRTFGYHEVFHVCVIAGATVHLVMVFVWVLPRSWA